MCGKMWESAEMLLDGCDSVCPEVVGEAASIRAVGECEDIHGSMVALARWLAGWKLPEVIGRAADLIRFGGMCEIDKERSV